jgi:catechol 2,3-dioxygenase-like lactoylglutathione lyase family enzyme
MNTTIHSHEVKRISPMLAVADMDDTLDFYTTVLGFTVAMKSPEYSIVDRGGSTIHFMKAASDSVMKAIRGHTEIYIEVDSIDSLWRHVETFKDKYKIRDLLAPRQVEWVNLANRKIRFM